MSDFKAKMHQNRLRLGLCSRFRWGAYSASKAGIKGILLREREGSRKGNGKRGREMQGRR